MIKKILKNFSFYFLLVEKKKVQFTRANYVHPMFNRKWFIYRLKFCKYRASSAIDKAVFPIRADKLPIRSLTGLVRWAAWGCVLVFGRLEIGSKFAKFEIFDLYWEESRLKIATKTFRLGVESLSKQRAHITLWAVNFALGSNFRALNPFTSLYCSLYPFLPNLPQYTEKNTPLSGELGLSI